MEICDTVIHVIDLRTQLTTHREHTPVNIISFPYETSVLGRLRLANQQSLHKAADDGTCIWCI